MTWTAAKLLTFEKFMKMNVLVLNFVLNFQMIVGVASA
jgi:hypothetical protein